MTGEPLPTKIYLSGGMHRDWQDRIRSVIKGPIYLDPREHGLTNPKDYVKRDLEMVREADLIIAYLESQNPSGIGLSVELGYAKALGKEIFLLCEQTERKWDFIRVLADKEFKSLDEMISGLMCKL